MDQRDQFLNQLSDLTGSRVVNRDNGTVDVFVGNATIVTGDFSYALNVTATDSTGAAVGKADIGNQLVATIGGQVAGPVAGSLKATLDGANKTLVDQKANLDTFANTLATKVNTAYGAPFFKNADTSAAAGAPIPASQLTLAVDTTTFRDSTATTGAGSADRVYAKAVSTAFTDVKSTWRTNVTNLAASAQSASNRADLASQVSLKSAAVADGVSGVNLDEEMTNLVAYQHAYSAAAKVLTTMDEALDSLLAMVR
jgi:flagellar hook-associated protein 1 FlgK